jgi:hypothetical protein
MNNIMNNPDYRAELQDLYTSIQIYTGLNPAAADVHPAELTRRLMDAMAASAAALAHPEPVGPTDEEVRKILMSHGILYQHQGNLLTAGNPGIPRSAKVSDIALVFRSVLARWGTPAIQPVDPTDEELARRFRVWWHDEGSGLPPLPGMDHKEHVRRISEIAWASGAYAGRYGTPAIEPVPVSERLPEVGDWVWHCYVGVRFWEHGRYNGRQFFIGDGPESQPATHWRPANALSTPEDTNA